MAKSVTPEKSLIDMLTSAVPVEPATRPRASVDIPDAIRDQVATMVDTGKVLVLDITDEGQFETVKAIYLDAAYEAGYSANVVRTYDNLRDKESRKWIGTRVSVGQRRGRGAPTANGTAPAQAEGASNADAGKPALDRGW